MKIHPNLMGYISFLLLALSASQIWAADVVISAPNSSCYVNSGSNALTITTTGSILVGCANTYGIQNTTPNIITDLSNAGTINPSSANRGIYSTGDINSLVNLSTGIINSGDRGFDTSRNSPIPVVGLIDNYGTISGGSVGINNYQSIITNLTNRAGAFISGASNSGIQVEGGLTSTIGTITNLGTINSSAGTGISSSGAITTLNNSGAIQGATFGISSSGVIDTITNTATIGGGTGTGILNSGTINTITNTNTGSITSSTGNAGVENNTASTIVTINNAGTISGPNGIWARSLISNLNNSGTISSSATGTNAAVYVGSSGRVTNFDNSGTISGASNGVFINSGAAAAAGIDTLTNTGIISGVTYGINNNSGVSTKFSVLNNQQGASSSALTYTGYLPNYYNIIISSTSSYGKLAVTNGAGSTAFGIYTGSLAANNTKYAAVLSGVSSSQVTNTSGTYGGYSWALILESGSSDIWDLIFGSLLTGPSVADTNQSLVNTASSLQSTYTLQNSVLANSFSYDCNVFGANNVCVSAGGRNTAVQAANGLNNTSALLIAAYRPHPNYRIGAYADQNLSVSNQGGTVNLGNNTPLIGLFGAWNEKLDGTGAEVKVSAAYGQKNTTVTRSVVGSGTTASEAGSGSSQLNSQGAQVTAKYGFAVSDQALISPYIGIRYTQNNMGGYTEGVSSAVTAPLTYSALNTNATTALAGVGASYKIIPLVTTFASAGVETDTNTANGTYSATNASIGNLTPVNFNANPVRTRPTATLGVNYDVAKNQRLGVTGIYRQEAYQAVSTTTVMATYTVGL